MNTQELQEHLDQWRAKMPEALLWPDRPLALPHDYYCGIPVFVDDGDWLTLAPLLQYNFSYLVPKLIDHAFNNEESYNKLQGFLDDSYSANKNLSIYRFIHLHEPGMHIFGILGLDYDAVDKKSRMFFRVMDAEKSYRDCRVCNKATP